MIELNVNGVSRTLDVEPDMPLLWALRETLQLTGTKFGCGLGLCGACTVHLDGKAVRSCSTPVHAAVGKAITTIESLGGDHPLQQAWLAHNVPQCGYCQSGQIMSAAALLTDNPSPDDEEIKQAMAGNLCRCGTYNKIHTAIRSVADRGSPTVYDPAGQEPSA